MKIKITKTQETIDDVPKEPIWKILIERGSDFPQYFYGLTWEEISALKEALAKIPDPNQ